MNDPFEIVIKKLEDGDILIYIEGAEKGRSLCDVLGLLEYAKVWAVSHAQTQIFDKAGRQ